MLTKEQANSIDEEKQKYVIISARIPTSVYKEWHEYRDGRTSTSVILKALNQFLEQQKKKRKSPEPDELEKKRGRPKKQKQS